MQIRYRNTMEHLVALQKFVLRNSEFGKKMMLHRFIAVETVIVLISIIFAINHNRFKVLLGFLVVSGLAWLFRERSVLLQFKRDFKRERRKDESGMFDKDRIMTVDAEGLTVEIGTQETRYSWDRIGATGQDRKHVFIVTNGVLHYVIPLSAFSKNEDPKAFLDAIATYRTSA